MTICYLSKGSQAALEMLAQDQYHQEVLDYQREQNLDELEKIANEYHQYKELLIQEPGRHFYEFRMNKLVQKAESLGFDKSWLEG